MNMKAVIQVDALTSGATIDNIAPLQTTIPSNDTFTYPNSGKTGAGWAKYQNITIPENSNAVFDFATDGTIDHGSTSVGFGTVVDTALKVNIYKVGTDIIIQNKTAAPIVLTYSILAV